MPERASVALNVIVTGVLFQPAAFGCTERVCDTVGGVLSMLTGGEVNVAPLPARSVTVTVRVRPEPSEVTASGLAEGVVEPTPERSSPAVNGTDTSVLF